VDVSPDGTTAVAATAPPALYDSGSAATSRGQLTFINLETGQVTTREVDQPAHLAVYSPDGGTVAAAGTDRTITFYDRSGAVRGESLLVDHTITDMQYRPDGNQLAVALSSGEVDIFDLRTNTLAMPPLPSNGTDQAFALSWNRVGDLLAVGMEQPGRNFSDRRPTGVNVWQVNSASWSAQVCSLAGRDLTAEEWRQYAGDSLPYRHVCADPPRGTPRPSRRG
jgi:WD40 repeat protein